MSRTVKREVAREYIIYGSKLGFQALMRHIERQNPEIGKDALRSAARELAAQRQGGARDITALTAARNL